MKPKEAKAQPLEIDDESLIEIMANYELGGLRVEDEDPSMRYFFAADDGDKVRPDGVHRIKQLGYQVSGKAHNSVDCVLMEIPRERWDRMQKLRTRGRIADRAKKMKEMRNDIGDNFVNLESGVR